MNQIRSKNPRLRLSQEFYEDVRQQYYVETVGDARVVARCRILRCTTRHFAATLVTTRRRT